MIRERTTSKGSAMFFLDAETARSIGHDRRAGAQSDAERDRLTRQARPGRRRALRPEHAHASTYDEHDMLSEHVPWASARLSADPSPLLPVAASFLNRLAARQREDGLADVC